MPQTDAEAADEPEDRYFEHHVKLLLPTGDIAGLATLAERHGARLSRNARRQHDGGAHERFVNQRSHGVGRTTSTERLTRLVDDLRAAGFTVVSVEQEYVVHDSNLGLDRGWLSR